MQYWCPKCERVVKEHFVFPGTMVHEQDCGGITLYLDEAMEQAHAENKVLTLSRKLIVEDSFNSFPDGTVSTDQKWNEDFVARIIARYEREAREALGVKDGHTTE